MPQVQPLPSQLAFSPRQLDREGATEHAPVGLAERFAAPDTRLLRVGRQGQVLDQATGTHPSGESYDPARHVFLGSVGATTWFARRAEDEELAGQPDAPGARSTVFEPATQELVWAAVAVLAWHDLDPRCERCHGRTEPTHGGFVRRCLECGAELYPRTDPAMIVALLDADDRLLLARNAARGGDWRSLLAGFVEAGESAEQCVAREVAEESGLRVTAVRYVTSQPWPFPRSLMLGFAARADGVPRVDGIELAAADWYSREDVDRALASGDLALPGPTSIARRLIDAWRAGDLTTSWVDAG